MAEARKLHVMVEAVAAVEMLKVFGEVARKTVVERSPPLAEADWDGLGLGSQYPWSLV